MSVTTIVKRATTALARRSRSPSEVFEEFFARLPWRRLLEDWLWAQLAPSEFVDCGGGPKKMISKLPMIEPGWSPSREHINDTRTKLNEVIDCLNAFEHAYTCASRGQPAGDRIECPFCHGSGGSGNSTPQKFVACAQCQGTGFIIG